MTHLEHAKLQNKALLADIEFLQRKYLEEDKKSSRYSIGCGFLMFLLIATNVTWLSMFLGG